MIFENCSRSPSFGVRPSRLSTARRFSSINLSIWFLLPRLSEYVDHRRLAALNDLDGLIQRGAELVGLGDRTESVDVQRARDRRQVGHRFFDADADAFVGHRPVAPAR